LTDSQHESQASFDEAIKALVASQTKTEKMVRAMGRFAMAIATDHEKRIFALENLEDA
jgi:hypothetical protein